MCLGPLLSNSLTVRVQVQPDSSLIHCAKTVISLMHALLNCTAQVQVQPDC